MRWSPCWKLSGSSRSPARGPVAPPAARSRVTVQGLDPLPQPTATGYQGILGRWFALGAGEGIKDIAGGRGASQGLTSPVNNHVAVLSADTYLLERIVPVGASAQGVSLSADGSRLYVALFQGGAIAVMDTRDFCRAQGRSRSADAVSRTPSTWLEVRPGVVLVVHTPRPARRTLPSWSRWTSTTRRRRNGWATSAMGVEVPYST